MDILVCTVYSMYSKYGTLCTVLYVWNSMFCTVCMEQYVLYCKYGTTYHMILHLNQTKYTLIVCRAVDPDRLKMNADPQSWLSDVLLFLLERIAFSKDLHDIVS